MCWQKLPGIKGKIVSVLARLDRLRAGASTTNDVEESQRRVVLFEWVFLVHFNQHPH